MRTLNIDALRLELRKIATQLKEAKKERRNPPGGYSSRTLMLKSDATILCAIRASHRSKVHLQKMTLEEQEKMIAGEKKRFALKELIATAA